MTIAPGAKLPEHYHQGTQVAHVIAGVLTYVRRSFGNSAPAVSPKDIARVRIEIVSRNTAWTDTELEQIEAALK